MGQFPRQLEHLSLAANRLESVSGLSVTVSLSCLHSLDLSYNLLVDISPLAGLPALKHLMLCHNLITSVDCLLTLSSLTELDLSSNRLPCFSLG